MAASPIASRTGWSASRRSRLPFALLVAVLLAACSTTPDRGRPGPDAGARAKPADAELGRGRASWAAALELLQAGEAPVVLFGP